MKRATWMAILTAVVMSAPRSEAAEPVQVPMPPALEVPIPPLFVAAPELPDTLEEDSCRDLSAELSRLERSILDVKARYWAYRMRHPGFSRGSLSSNPGSEIRSPWLRRSFYRLLQRYHEDTDLERPSQFEVAAMIRTMRRMLSLIEDCGGEAPELRRAIGQAAEA